MPKLLLEHTFRGLSGEDAKADPVRETLDGISRASSEMDWENIADDSLSASHIRPELGAFGSGGGGGYGYTLLKRARGSFPPNRAFTPSWEGLDPSTSASVLFTYPANAAGNWHTVARTQVGPFTTVGGSVNDGQSRVFLIGSVRTTSAGRQPFVGTPAMSGLPLPGLFPPQRAFLRFLIPHSGGDQYTTQQGIGMNCTHTAGVIESFVPSQQWHVVQMQIMCEFRGNTAGLVGNPAFELAGPVLILSAEVASFEVNK